MAFLTDPNQWQGFMGSFVGASVGAVISAVVAFRVARQTVVSEEAAQRKRELEEVIFDAVEVFNQYARSAELLDPVNRAEDGRSTSPLAVTESFRHTFFRLARALKAPRVENALSGWLTAQGLAQGAASIVVEIYRDGRMTVEERVALIPHIATVRNSPAAIAELLKEIHGPDDQAVSTFLKGVDGEVEELRSAFEELFAYDPSNQGAWSAFASFWSLRRPKS